MSAISDVRGSLSLDDKNILLVLAVLGRALTPTELKQMITALGWQLDGQETTLASLLNKHWRERLEALGALEVVSGAQLQVPSVLAEQLLRRAHPETFRGIYSIYQTRYRRFDHATLPGELVRGPYYLNEATVLFHYAQQQPFSFIWADELVECFERSLAAWDETWFKNLPPAIQWQLLGYLQTLAWMGVVDLRPYLPAMAHCAENASDQLPAFQAMYAVARVLTGETVALESLNVASSSWLASAAGFVAFNAGNPQAAVGYFAQAMKQRKREFSARLESLDDPCMLFYQLALLQLGDKSSLERIAKLQKADDPYSDSPERTAAVDAASRLLFRKSGGAAYNSAAHENIGAISCLISACHSRWFDIELKAKEIEALQGIRDDARQYGLPWHVAQLDALLMDQAADSTASVSIARIIEPVPEWQLSLNALTGMMAPQEQTAHVHRESRLAWFIGDDFELEPREQKRGKSGWSKGRKVALMRLRTERDDFDFLSPADERICDCISVVRQYDRYGYDKEAAVLTSQALMAAVGHPHVFWPDETGEPVEVRETEPELVVLSQGEQLLLTLTPKVADLTEYLIVERRGFNQLDVTSLSEQHLEIARILGPDGLRVPVSAREQVLQSISAIAPLLTVQSDIGGGVDESAEFIPCDTRLHLQIQPAGEGLRMGVFVRPFGEQGPLFSPGVGGLNVISEIDGKRVRSERDFSTEQESLKGLIENVSVFQLNPGTDWLLEDPESALEALDGLRSYTEEMVLSWPQGRSMSLLGHNSATSMAFNISSQREWFAIDGELKLDDDTVMSLQKVLQLVRQSDGRFLKIGESEFFALSANLHKKLKSLADFADEDGRFHPLASGAIAELTQDMLGDAATEWTLQQDKLQEARELELQLPSTLGAELRDYQHAGFDWMMRLAHWGGGACLADDMGLGKTIQILAVLLARAEEGPALVLAPTSVCSNWLNEAARFAPTLRMHRFGDGDRQAMISGLGPRDVVVSSYGLMNSESTLLTPVQWTTLVADEAQALKNPRALRSKAVAALSANFRIIATGTPIENHLGELWSLFQIINPGLLGTQKKFEKQFISPMEHGDQYAKQRLRALVAPFILRRHKSQVLTELPSRTEINRVIEASDEEKVFYEALRRQALDDLADPSEAAGNQRFKILAEITRLRRACCNPKLVSPAVDIEGSKLKELQNIVGELVDNGHKALIFSQFVDHLKLIRTALDKQGVSYQYLDGSTPVKKRQEAVDNFQAGKGDVFLISLKAGGSGLNLTAADYVIHMDPWWNPAVEDQASDRAHRMGQLRPVTIYRLIMAGTIEEKILSLHQQKRELADSLLEGREVAASVDVQDMLELLQDQSLMGLEDGL